MAGSGNKSSVLAGMVEGYLRDFAKASGKTIGSSSVVRAAAMHLVSLESLEDLQKNGKPAIRALASAVSGKLHGEGKITRNQKENMQAAIEEFFTELAIRLPEEGDPSVDAMFNRYKVAFDDAIKKVKSTFTPRPSEAGTPVAPTTSSEAGAIITNKVLVDIHALLGNDPAEIKKFLNLRTVVLSRLYELSKRVTDERSIDAGIAFNDGYYGNAATNCVMLSGLMSSTSETELVNRAISNILNLSKDDHGAKRFGVKFERVGVKVVGAVLNEAQRIPERAKVQGVPWLKLIGEWAGVTHAMANAMVALCVLAWLSMVYSGNMIGSAVFTIVNFVVLITAFVVPVQIVGTAMSTTEKALHFTHLLLSAIPFVPEPAKRKMYDPNDMSKMIGTDHYVKIVRWRAITAPMGMQVFVYAQWVLMYNEARVSWDDHVTFALHILILGIVIGTMLKFKGLTPDREAKDYYTITIKGLNILMIASFGAIVLAKVVGTSTSAPLTYVGLSALEAGRQGLAQSVFQGAILVVVLLSGVTVISMGIEVVFRKRFDLVSPMMVGVLVFIGMAFIHDKAVEANPLPQAPASLSQWAEEGMSNPFQERARARELVNGQSSNANGSEESVGESTRRKAEERRDRIKARRAQRSNR